MNMYRIDAVELSRTKTLITNFMLETSTNLKTFLELVAIFENSYQRTVDDRSDDLRILRFTEDMANGNWNGDIIIQSQNGHNRRDLCGINALAKGGTHEGGHCAPGQRQRRFAPCDFR